MAGYFRTITVALLTFALMSCGGERSIDPTTNGSNDLANKISEHVFELGYGQTTVLTPENLSVTFNSVIQDSRCASDVVCIWAGEATIGLRLVSESFDTNFVTLSLLGGCESGCESYASIKDTLDYRFQLVQVDPYPISTVQTPVEEYVVTLAIFPHVSMATVEDEVVIRDVDPSLIQDARFILEDVSVEDDILTLTIEYSGGCNDHEVALTMSPAAFMESLPVQANLYLRHTDFDDPCDAWFRKSISFDLRPIAQLHEIDYGKLDCIALNVYDFFEGAVPGQKTTVIYHPEGAPQTSWCSPLEP